MGRLHVTFSPASPFQHFRFLIKKYSFKTYLLAMEYYLECIYHGHELIHLLDSWHLKFPLVFVITCSCVMHLGQWNYLRYLRKKYLKQINYVHIVNQSCVYAIREGALQLRPEAIEDSEVRKGVAEAAARGKCICKHTWARFGCSLQIAQGFFHGWTMQWAGKRASSRSLNPKLIEKPFALW